MRANLIIAGLVVLAVSLGLESYRRGKAYQALAKRALQEKRSGDALVEAWRRRARNRGRALERIAERGALPHSETKGITVREIALAALEDDDAD